MALTSNFLFICGDSLGFYIVDRVIFKSSKNDAELVFRIAEKFGLEMTFNLEVKTRQFSGVATASTYHSGSPASLFQSLAKDWRGWKGERTWSDLENCVSLSASSDLTGHISIIVELRGEDSDSRLRVRVMFDAGQLENMANEISAFLP